MYSRSNDRFAPCDSRGFGQLFPISHAPFDRTINQKYDFARAQFRDTTGKLIRNGVDIGGTYPWMDKKAKNLVLMGVDSHLYNLDPVTRRVTTRYETRCVTPGCLINPASLAEVNDRIEDLGKIKGYIAMGFWTQGKMVFMDTPISGTDYGLLADDSSHRSVKLYSDDSPNGGFVRIGMGRDSGRYALRRLPAHTRALRCLRASRITSIIYRT